MTAFKQALYAVCEHAARKDWQATAKGPPSCWNAPSAVRPDKTTAKKVAKSVICSSLFKAAMFGADANWGRILCAIGYTDAAFDISKIAVDLSSNAGCIHVCENGAGVPFSEETAKIVLLRRRNSCGYRSKRWQRLRHCLGL